MSHDTEGRTRLEKVQYLGQNRYAITLLYLAPAQSYGVDVEKLGRDVAGLVNLAVLGKLKGNGFNVRQLLAAGAVVLLDPGEF